MKNFEEIYNEIKDNEKIKELWKKSVDEKKRKNKIICASIIIIAIASLILITELIGFNFITIFFTLFSTLFMSFIIFIFSLFFQKNYREYVDVYKKIIIEKIINNFYTNVEYYPNKKMLKEIYNEPEYNEYYNRYYSDDYIEARINNKYDIDIAEVKTVYEKRRRDSRGRTHTTRITKFHGLFSKIVIDKSINSELKIKRNGNFAFSKNKLEMDSSEFESYFDVQSTNKIIGMQLLTADIMQDLIDFENKTNIKYDIVIKNNNIYLRFHCNIMFEPNISKEQIVDKSQLEKYFYMLNFTYNLSNKIIKVINETEI